MRESKNKLVIIGTLKDKKVNYGTTKAGDDYISIDLTIESDVDGKISANRVSLWSKQSSKLAKGFNTVAEEYKTIAEHGKENADRVKVTGSYEMNEYVKDGELKTSTRAKGLFVSRVDDSVSDVAGVEIECVIVNSLPEMKDGKMTGRNLTKVFSVGYNNSVNEFDNIIVEKELVSQFQQLFPIGTTANFHIRLDNYAEVEETKTQETPLAFGTMLSGIGSSTVKNFVNEKVIVGGLPIVVGKYTNEEIQEMKKLRELARNEKIQAPATPITSSNTTTASTTQGFGVMPF